MSCVHTSVSGNKDVGKIAGLHTSISLLQMGTFFIILGTVKKGVETMHA
jgi:hypothetical protein